MGIRRQDPSGHSAKSDDRDEWLLPDERSKVESWRLKILIEAGYPLAIAERLAMSLVVDLHLACDMLSRGCSPDTAAEILL